MAIVYLGVGSNLGDRQKNISAALRLITQAKIEILRQSSIIETDPQGGPAAQGKYLNAVIKIQTDLPPLKLLACLKTIEKNMGRIKTIQNGPREIDLDILLYDEISFQSSQLTIPHPRMRERSFVMEPLCEIAPELKSKLVYAKN